MQLPLFPPERKCPASLKFGHIHATCALLVQHHGPHQSNEGMSWTSL